MKPEIKEMYSLQLMQKIEDFWPEHINNFGISIRLMIGPENSKASESFDILVCTPDWIKDQFKEERCTWGLHMLIVLEYDLSLIRTEVDRYLARCTGEDWSEVAKKLSRMGAWEFEGYTA